MVEFKIDLGKVGSGLGKAFDWLGRNAQLVSVVGGLAISYWAVKQQQKLKEKEFEYAKQQYEEQKKIYQQLPANQSQSQNLVLYAGIGLLIVILFIFVIVAILKR